MGTQKSATIEEMKTTLIVLGLAAYSQAKFCPGEKNGNKCVAGDNSYKCAVFFENLTSKRPLTWIGALPDALKKAKSPEEVQDILGADVTEESFSQLTSCDASTANARCYSILNDLKLPFYYSACNGEWTPITDGSKALFFEEPLCCTSQGLYEKCDGTPFNSVC